MADIVDRATRSRMMSGIRSKDTRPEVAIRSALHMAGFRFRLHARELPGKPDLVFAKYRAVLFIHGCFWHGHECRYFRWPASRAEFWRKKITDNRQRDARAVDGLLSRGWRVGIIRECALRDSCDMPGIRAQIAGWLVSGSNALLEITG